MYIEPIYSLSFLGVTLIFTYLFVKRLAKKGCLAFTYIGLVIFCINIFTVMSWALMYSSAKDVYAITTSGRQYRAKIVHYTEEERFDSDDKSYYRVYIPTVRFTTHSGDLIEKTIDSSTSNVRVGDIYNINYNESTGKVMTLGFEFIITLVTPFIFCFIFTFLFVGIIIYALGFQMEGYKAVVSKIGLVFFIPFLMIGFNALLLYGLFFGNSAPGFVTGLLVFFSLALTLATWGYFKTIMLKGVPKMRRVGNNKWIGDWEEK